MGKKGDREVQSLGNQLVVSPAEKVILHVASWSKTQEATYILDYACGTKGEAFGSEYLLKNHLPSLGLEATNSLLVRLQDVLNNPKKYRSLMQGQGDFAALFRGATITGDRRFMPVLKRFEAKFQSEYQHNSRSVLGWAYVYSSQARLALEHGAWSSKFP